MSTTHTPIPWHIGKPIPQIYGPKGEHIANLQHIANSSSENMANGHMIVRAVNSHDKLLAALNFADAVIAPLLAEKRWSLACRAGWADSLGVIRAAISEAEGRT